MQNAKRNTPMAAGFPAVMGVGVSVVSRRFAVSPFRR
jgi:hypothetical protein